MKKYLLSFIFIFSLLFVVSYAKAVSINSNGNGNREQKTVEVRETEQNMQETRAMNSDDISPSTQKMEAVKTQVRNAVEMRIGKKLDEQKNKIANEFENVVNNERNLIMRVQSRISQTSMKGIDMASSSFLLEKAKEQLTLAETELSKLENLLVQNIPSATSTDKVNRNSILQSLRAQREKTKTALKMAHATIVDVIASIKVGLMKKESVSTSTENN